MPSSASNCDDDATLLELSGKGILGPASPMKQQKFKIDVKVNGVQSKTCF